VRPTRGILTAMTKAAALVVGVLLLAGVASAATRAALRVSSVDPLIVQGSHFRAKERVRVTVTTLAETWKRSAVSTSAGTFKLVIESVPLGRCGFGVRATGSKGSIATYKRPPLPACMP
jgi:hypothetical protein